MKTVLILTKTILNEAKNSSEAKSVTERKSYGTGSNRTYATKACVHQRAHETAPKQKR